MPYPSEELKVFLDETWEKLELIHDRIERGHPLPSCTLRDGRAKMPVKDFDDLACRLFWPHWIAGNMDQELRQKLEEVFCFPLMNDNEMNLIPAAWLFADYDEYRTLFSPFVWEMEGESLRPIIKALAIAKAIRGEFQLSIRDSSGGDVGCVTGDGKLELFEETVSETDMGEIRHLLRAFKEVQWRPPAPVKKKKRTRRGLFVDINWGAATPDDELFRLAHWAVHDKKLLVEYKDLIWRQVKDWLTDTGRADVIEELLRRFRNDMATKERFRRFAYLLENAL